MSKLNLDINMPFQKGHAPFVGTEATRFKKGHNPWNKGIPCSDETKRKISCSRRRLPARQCPTCKGMYLPYFSKQITCSKECSKIWMKCVMIGKNKGRRMSIATEFKKGENLGEDHPNWAGGVSKIKKYTRLTSKREWREKRQKILGERGEICSRCSKFGNCIDHIVPWRVTRDNEESNLQVLCRSCNSKKMQEDRIKWPPKSQL